MNNKITIYGTGYFVKIYGVNNLIMKYLDAFSDSKKMELLNDHELFEKITGTSFADFIPDKQLTIYKTDEQTRLEISKGTRKTKIFFQQLIRNDVLFTYSFVNQESFTLPKGIYVFEEDIGNFGFMKFSNDFVLDKLMISTAKCHEINEVIVSRIEYDNQSIILEKSDTLCRRRIIGINHL